MPQNEASSAFWAQNKPFELRNLLEPAMLVWFSVQFSPLSEATPWNENKFLWVITSTLWRNMSEQLSMMKIAPSMWHDEGLEAYMSMASIATHLNPKE